LVVVPVLDEEAPGYITVESRSDVLTLFLVHHAPLDVVSQNGYILENTDRKTKKKKYIYIYI